MMARPVTCNQQVSSTSTYLILHSANTLNSYLSFPQEISKPDSIHADAAVHINTSPCHSYSICLIGALAARTSGYAGRRKSLAGSDGVRKMEDLVAVCESVNS